MVQTPSSAAIARSQPHLRISLEDDVIEGDPCGHMRLETCGKWRGNEDRRKTTREDLMRKAMGEFPGNRSVKRMPCQNMATECIE